VSKVKERVKVSLWSFMACFRVSFTLLLP